MAISTTNRRAIVACLSLGALATLIGLNNAQLQAKPRRGTTVTQSTDANTQNTTNKDANKDNRADRMNHRFAANDRMDECFAKALIMANENEIRACQIANERGSAQVKQFAQTMQQQHQDFLAKLQAFEKSHAKSADKHSAAYRFNKNNKNDDADKNANDSKDNAAKVQQTGAVKEDADANKEHANKDHDPFFHHMGQIHKELADQCRISTEKELTSKTGAEFDACFVGMQIAAHMHMLDTLTVFERHASPELKTLITAGKQTTQTHMDHAKSLMKALPKDVGNAPVNNTNANVNQGNK